MTRNWFVCGFVGLDRSERGICWSLCYEFCDYVFGFVWPVYAYRKVAIVFETITRVHAFQRWLRSDPKPLRCLVGKCSEDGSSCGAKCGDPLGADIHDITLSPNVAHWRQKAERSGTFCRLSEFALLSAVITRILSQMPIKSLL